MAIVKPDYCTNSKNPQCWETKHIEGRNYYICKACNRQACKEDKEVIDKIYNPINGYKAG